MYFIYACGRNWELVVIAKNIWLIASWKFTAELLITIQSLTFLLWFLSLQILSRKISFAGWIEGYFVEAATAREYEALILDNVGQTLSKHQAAVTR